MYADTSHEKLDHAKSVGADLVHLVKRDQMDDALEEIKKLMSQTRPHITFACCDCPQILNIAAEVRSLQNITRRFAVSLITANETRREHSDGWNRPIVSMLLIPMCFEGNRCQRSVELL